MPCIKSCTLIRQQVMNPVISQAALFIFCLHLMVVWLSSGETKMKTFHTIACRLPAKKRTKLQQLKQCSGHFKQAKQFKMVSLIYKSSDLLVGP